MPPSDLPPPAPILVDQSDWGRIRVAGADRVRFAQAMCTADVTKVGEGRFARAAILSAKGRVQSVVDIVNRGADLLFVCEPALTDKTVALLRKHAVMDEVEIELEPGPCHRQWGEPGVVWDAPPLLAPPPAPTASPAEVEVRRIEAGLPRYGVDVSEDDFPFESLLARCIDYRKGCYLGQEPVFRVHQRGSAKRQMRGLAFEADLPAVGSAVCHPRRDPAGVITSAAISPGFGPIALAYLHDPAWTPGDQVTASGLTARIVELPFGS